ncbi:2,5-didehydrogluconate reductase DkgB [Alteromonas naphthalenivorans]|jgi:2,5-diketo-D-gluconate reductase B|uniref:2,5-diketo-D-gluconate reductase B n=1 Tax=Alteromonas naphthalenivorans TaxID=715451 RepID=F5ZD81_ALTNA|nr:2,5-didehydrogluconate reductase DkgB [Alteromonas naphthalenivorans]AEF03843.1 2,5-diketo-D-gluconate reductase B [Alteromonas naphthalenivorans]
MKDMPQLGMGTFRLEGDTALNAVTDALDVGFRHVDTAQIYKNEELVGDAIKTSGITRSDLFITTKVWYESLSEDKFIPSVHESLSKLKVEYVDLLLIHWPYPGNDISLEDYLMRLKQAKELGLTRHIGVSNFTIDQIKQAEKILGKGEIYTNQIELHPFMQNRQVVKACEERGIGVTAYMPFAVGDVMKDDTLNAIADAHDSSPAQVVLAWLDKKGINTIPSSTSKEHLAQNFSYTDISLTDDDITRIDELDNGERIVNPDFAPKWD